MKLPIPRIAPLLLLVCFTGILVHSVEAAGNTARIEVVLVEAGNSDGGVDPALKAYAGTLQRLFRFGSYRQVSRKGMSLEIPGENTISLGGGQSLKLQATGAESGAMVADLTWLRGSTRLLHTRLQLRKGNPAVLGGPSSSREGGSYLLILTLR